MKNVQQNNFINSKKIVGVNLIKCPNYPFNQNCTIIFNNFVVLSV